MKTYGREDVQSHVFLTSALVGGEWSASRPGHFFPGERVVDSHWTGGWLGPRTGLDDVERRKILHLPGFKLQPFSRRAHSKSLYRLRYPGSLVYYNRFGSADNLTRSALSNFPMVLCVA
jgi:hypothetical protein